MIFSRWPISDKIATVLTMRGKLTTSNLAPRRLEQVDCFLYIVKTAGGINLLSKSLMLLRKRVHCAFRSRLTDHLQYRMAEAPARVNEERRTTKSLSQLEDAFEGHRFVRDECLGILMSLCGIP